MFKKGVLKTNPKAPDAAKLRIPLRMAGGASTSNSGNYTVSSNEATKGEVAAARDVVPYDKQSDIVEIAFPDGNAFSAGNGANFFLGQVPDNYDEFSFWVYPRVGRTDTKSSAKSASSRKATLQFYLEDEGDKRHFLAIDLDLDKWQRVVLSSKAMKLVSSGRICIVGDPKLPEYKDGAKVSFEFNGFSVVGDSHLRHGKTGLKSSRVVVDKKETRFILTGEPGKYFEYRHRFAEPVELEAASELSGVKTLKYVYRKEAQLLEISGFFSLFPQKDEEAEDSKCVLHEEKREIADAISSGCRGLPLPADARKFCTIQELAAYEEGESAILVIQSRLK